MKQNLTFLFIGFIMGTAPQWILANNLDWDEVIKSLAGGGGVGIAAIIYAIKGRNPNASKEEIQ